MLLKRMPVPDVLWLWTSGCDIGPAIAGSTKKLEKLDKIFKAAPQIKLHPAAMDLLWQTLMKIYPDLPTIDLLAHHRVPSNAQGIALAIRTLRLDYEKIKLVRSLMNYMYALKYPVPGDIALTVREVMEAESEDSELDSDSDLNSEEDDDSDSEDW